MTTEAPIAAYDYFHNILSEANAGHVVATISRSKDGTKHEAVVCTQDFWAYPDDPRFDVPSEDSSATLLVLVGEAGTTLKDLLPQGESRAFSSKLRDLYGVTPKGVEWVTSRGVVELQIFSGEKINVETKREDAKERWWEVPNFHVNDPKIQKSLAFVLVTEIQSSLMVS